MKRSLTAKIGASFLLGSLLGVLSMGSAMAVDSDLYDSLKAFEDQAKQYRSGDYNTMEPTAAGPQGPVRTDMMKDSASYDSKAGAAGWDELRMRLGPIGGEDTN